MSHLRAPFLLLLALLAFAAACGFANNRGYNAGPNYSSTPCADNCGNDAQCQASCTNMRNPNIPTPVYNGEVKLHGIGGLDYVDLAPLVLCDAAPRVRGGHSC
jgi:hypothetical protein